MAHVRNLQFATSAGPFLTRQWWTPIGRPTTHLPTNFIHTGPKRHEILDRAFEARPPVTERRSFAPHATYSWNVCSKSLVPGYNDGVTNDSPPDPTLDQRQLLLEQVDGRLNIQFDELDGLDRKATTILAATGVLLGLVINNADNFATAPRFVSWVFYSALAVLAGGLAAGVLALWPREVQVVPDPKSFLEQHGESMPVDILGELISTKTLAFDINFKVARKKGVRVRIQMLLLASGGGLLVAAYITERLS